MKAAIYARVSTLDQEPENQLAEVRRYVQARASTPALLSGRIDNEWRHLYTERRLGNQTTTVDPATCRRQRLIVDRETPKRSAAALAGNSLTR